MRQEPTKRLMRNFNSNSVIASIPREVQTVNVSFSTKRVWMMTKRREAATRTTRKRVNLTLQSWAKTLRSRLRTKKNIESHLYIVMNSFVLKLSLSTL